MSLHLIGHVDLPAHLGRGGFDHAAVHAATGTRNALEVMNEHLATGAVLEVDADEALTAVGDEFEAADVALFDEDSSHSVVELVV